jgi:tetratricopeptide (TPR) repeat protein
MNRLFRLSLMMIAVASVAVAQTSQRSESSPEAKPAQPTQPAAQHKVDKAAAYYHYTLAHMYEEMVTAYGRSDLAAKATEEYRQAIEADPSSEFLTSALAELYVKTGRIADAVREAQDIIKRDPKNLEAHKLLGRIYLRSLGDMPGGSGSDNILKLAIDQYEQITKLDPTSVDDHLLLGRLYRLNNDLQKAEAELQTAIKLDPNSEEAVTTLAMLYTDEGDTAHALKVLSSIPDSARSAKLYSALGAAYEQRKDYKNAIDAYKHAIVLDRDNLDAIRGLAENEMNDGQFEAALEQYKVIADSNPEDAQTYVRMADIYRRQGKYDQALENLKRAETLVPDTMDVPYSIAAVYQAQGRYDEAAKILQDLIKKTEKSETGTSQADRNNRAIFVERLGMIYREQENYTAAVETFRKMLTLGDENARSGYQEIIDTYRDAKQWPQATAAAREAVQKLPNDRDLRMVLDAQLADTGQIDQAVADMRSMLKGGAEDRDVYVRLGIVYTRTKQWNDALQALAKAEEVSTKADDKAYVLFLRGDLYQRQKNFDAAEIEFKKVLSMTPPTDPQAAATLNYLGYMNADRGVKLEESLNLIKQALTFEPNNPAYLDSLGWAYFKLGKYDLAEDNLLKASQHVMGADPTVQEHLGDLYQKTGRLKLAATHWERAVAEWSRTVAPEVDQEALAKVQKKLESAKVRLAKEQTDAK